ncbi:MAG: arsenic resistance protein, partial [Endozoicomonas sp.]
AFLLGITNVIVPWSTLFLSVILFIVIPLIAGLLTRKVLNSEKALQRFGSKIKPLSTLGLILTVVLLFGFQAPRILAHPVDILLIAIPLIIQTILTFAIAYFWMYKWKEPHSIAAPGGMIGASNFFELAVAVAISLFGLNSGAALATVVGVLVEVPIMLLLVAYANRTRYLFPVSHAA